MDRMRQLSQDIAAGITDDTLRARWLEWTTALAEQILILDRRLHDMRSLIVQLSDKMTAAVADAMTDYAAAEELRHAAAREHLVAMLRHERDTMAAAIAHQIEELTARVDRLGAHMDDLHLEILAALMALKSGKPLRGDGGVSA